MSVNTIPQCTPRNDVHSGSFPWIHPPHFSRGALFWVLEGGWRSSKEVEPIESVGQGGAPGARYICGVIVMHLMPFHMESVPGASGHASLWLWTWKLCKFGWSCSSEPNTSPQSLKRCFLLLHSSSPAAIISLPRVPEQLSVCAGTLVCVGGILVFSIDLLCSHIWISALTDANRR